MNPDPLVGAIAAALILLDDSSDEDIDPRIAVRGMELIGYELKQISSEDLDEFIRAIERVAASEEDPRTADYIRNIPFMAGLVSRGEV